MPTTLTEKMPITAMPRMMSSERMRSAEVVAMKCPLRDLTRRDATPDHRAGTQTASRSPISDVTWSNRAPRTGGDPSDRQAGQQAMRDQLLEDRQGFTRRGVALP